MRSAWHVILLAGLCLVGCQPEEHHPPIWLGLLPGDGSGGFTPVRYSTTGAPALNGMALGDLDGDGILDLVLVTDTSDSILALRGPDLTEPLLTRVQAGVFGGAIIADVDGNGANDIVVIAYPGLGMLLSDGAGGWSWATLTLADIPSVLMPGHLRAPGSPELLVARPRHDEATIIGYDGAGGLTIDLTIGAGRILGWIDLDGDGFSDLIAQQPGTDTGQLFLADGLGGFDLPTSFTLPDDRITAVSFGDFDGDTFIDLAFAYPGGTGGRVAVLPGDGAGNLGAAIISSVSELPQSMAAADLDGDGAAELVTQGAFSVLRLANDGAASFTATRLDAIPGLVSLGDVTDDGATDLLVLARQPEDSNDCIQCHLEWTEDPRRRHPD